MRDVPAQCGPSGVGGWRPVRASKFSPDSFWITPCPPGGQGVGTVDRWSCAASDEPARCCAGVGILGGSPDRPVRAGHILVSRQGDPQRRQNRVPGRLVRRHGHPGNRVRRTVDEPRHPRTHQLPIQHNLDGHMRVISLPARIPPQPRPPQMHIMAPPSPLPTSKSRTLPRTQIPANRPRQRRQRRHRRGAAALSNSRGMLGHQLPVNRSRVPTPGEKTRMQLRRESEPLPPTRPCTPLPPSNLKPPPHRPERHPHRPRHQPDMLRGQLPTPVQHQQTRHRLLPPQQPRHTSHRPRDRLATPAPLHTTHTAPPSKKTDPRYRHGPPTNTQNKAAHRRRRDGSPPGIHSPDSGICTTTPQPKPAE